MKKKILVVFVLMFVSYIALGQKYHDAVAFGLKGNVKEYYEYNEDTKKFDMKYEFNKDGMIIFPYDEWDSEIERENGYITSIVYHGVFSITKFSFEYINTKLATEWKTIIYGVTLNDPSLMKNMTKTTSMKKYNDTYCWLEANTKRDKVVTSYVDNVKFDKYMNVVSRDCYEGIVDEKTNTVGPGKYLRTEKFKVVYWDDENATNNSSSTNATNSSLGNNTSNVNNKTTNTTTATNTTTSSSYSSASTTTSSYTSYSSYSSKKSKYSYWPYSTFYQDPVLGMSFGWNRRTLRAKNNSGKIHTNIWGEPGNWTDGLHMGITAYPTLSWGLGLYTGLFFEFYYSKWEEAGDGYYDTYMEYNFYVPVDISFRIPFNKTSALYLRGGLGVDISAYNELSYSQDSFVENMGSIYGDGVPKRFNLSLEYGASLRIKYLMFFAAYQKGLNKHAVFEGYSTTQDKFTLGLQIVF